MPAPSHTPDLHEPGADRVVRGGWALIWLLFVAATINYVDRQTLALVQPKLAAEFGFSNRDYASMVSWFLIAYAVMYTGSGKLIDWLGSRIGMVASILVWSLAECLHATARGITGFRIYRAMLGCGEPGMFPAAVKALREYFPESRRAIAFGIFNAGTSLGPAIAPPLIVWIVITYGWRTAFLVTGLLGLLWLVPWIVITARLRPAAPVEAEESKSRPPWAALFARRQFWGIMAGRIFADPAWYFYLFWLPPYLSHERHFSYAAIGRYGALIPFLTAIVGNIAGGWMSGALVRRGWPVLRARKTAMALTVVLMPIILLGVKAASDLIVVGAIALATFAHQSWSSNISTMPADAIPAALVGSVAGLAGTAGSIAGVFFTQFTGWAADRHHYAWVFAVATGIYPIGLLLVTWLVKQPWLGGPERQAV